jgi:hypothetical protein
MNVYEPEGSRLEPCGAKILVDVIPVETGPETHPICYRIDTGSLSRG